MGHELLITFASWEDRFRLGFEEDLRNADAGRALVFGFKSYANRTEGNRHSVEAACAENEVEHHIEWLDVDNPVSNWDAVNNAIGTLQAGCSGVLLDVSTMPREIIWYVLWHLEQVQVDSRYVYHSPEKYGDDWLSRNPQAPRLVYKLSGLSSVSVRTALLVTVGFDFQRVKRLASWFEPAKLVVGFQSSSGFVRNDLAMALSQEQLVREYAKECDCEAFELDAFGDDRGLAAIQRTLEDLDGEFNVIMGSLGPKLTAISLFKLQRMRQERGLVYAPASQFSLDYSFGIGRQYGGTV